MNIRKKSLRTPLKILIFKGEQVRGFVDIAPRLPFLVDITEDGNQKKTCVGRDATHYLFKIRVAETKGDVDLTHFPFFHRYAWCLTPKQHAKLEQTTKKLRALKAQMLQGRLA